MYKIFIPGIGFGLAVFGRRKRLVRSAESYLSIKAASCDSRLPSFEFVGNELALECLCIVRRLLLGDKFADAAQRHANRNKQNFGEHG